MINVVLHTLHGDPIIFDTTHESIHHTFSTSYMFVFCSIFYAQTIMYIEPRTFRNCVSRWEKVSKNLSTITDVRKHWQSRSTWTGDWSRHFCCENCRWIECMERKGFLYWVTSCSMSPSSIGLFLHWRMFSFLTKSMVPSKDDNENRAVHMNKELVNKG